MLNIKEFHGRIIDLDTHIPEIKKNSIFPMEANELHVYPSKSWM